MLKNLTVHHAVKNKLRYQKRAKDWIVKIAVYFILVNLAFVFLYPFLQVLIRSFKSADDLLNVTVTWIPRNPQIIDNYVRAFGGVKFIPHFFYSVLLSLVPTAGAVLSAALVGYGFARYRFKGRGVLFVLVLLTLIVPPQTVMIPLYELYNAFGWLSEERAWMSWLPLIIPSFFASGLKGGLFVFIFRQCFRGIPAELEEASRLDGCGMFRSFFHVALPLSGSAILVSSILSIVWQWNNYFEPQVFIISDDMWTLPMKLGNIFNEFFSSQQDAYGVYNAAIVAAATILVLLPMVLFYAIVQRLFVKGIERTGLVE